MMGDMSPFIGGFVRSHIFAIIFLIAGRYNERRTKKCLPGNEED